VEQRRPQIDHELLLAQSGWVRGLAQNLVQDPAGAEDVVQDTMLAALASPPQRVDDVRSLRAWLSRVATNLANLTTRRSARRRSREEVVARPEAVSSAAEAVEQAGQLRLVVDAVLELDEPYRSTVLLRYFDGLTTEQIAERTAATPVTVRKRLSRGIERLRRRLDEGSDGNRRQWIAAMLPFVRRSFPRIPRPEQVIPPWLVGIRLAALTLGLLTVAGLSALVAVTLRSQASGEVAAPIATEPEVAQSKRTPVPASDFVIWDLPYEAVERATPVRIEPGIEPEPELPEDQSRPMPAPPRRVAGRVVDLEGYGLPGLALVAEGAEGEVLARTGRGGHFAFEAASAGADFVLTARAPGFATLRTSAVRAEAASHWDREHVLVAERSLDLVGEVLDEYGAPLEGAELSVVVPDETYLALSLPIRRSQQVEKAGRSDELGAFRIEGVVAHAAIELETRFEGYLEDRRPIMSAAGGPFTIRLRRPALPQRRLEGIVVLPSGRPASGAEVRLGRATVRTSPSGRFSLPHAPGVTGTLVAHVDGWPPSVENIGPPGEGGGKQPPHFRKMQIEGQLLSIGGTLTGPEGEALGGWTVTAADEGGDPRYPDVPAGAPVRRTRTAADGSFQLAGLLERDYTLRTFDPRTLTAPDPTRVAAGERGVRLRAAGRLAEPEQGQVVDRHGTPLPFARVTRALPAGGGTTVLGEAAIADDQGRFLLPGRSGRPASLLVQHTSVIAAQFGGGGVLEVAQDAWFIYTGGSWPVQPDRLEVHDQNGVPLLLHGPTSSGMSVELNAGRTGVVGVTEDGRVLVLFQRGQILGRVALNLIPGEVIVVGGMVGQGSEITTAAGPARSSKWGQGTPRGLPPGAPREEGDDGENSGNSVTPVGSRQP
jgi:RNA polymerase sigma-70 factor (ECF subfamily)